MLGVSITMHLIYLLRHFLWLIFRIQNRYGEIFGGAPGIPSLGLMAAQSDGVGNSVIRHGLLNLCSLSHPEKWVEHVDIHVFYSQEKGDFLFIKSKKIIRDSLPRRCTSLGVGS